MLDQLSVQDNGIPIYVQLREQILALLGRGILKPGAQLPTMRQVAVALKIDLNTVKHAYDELERAGAIVLVRGSGTFIAENPPAIDLAAQEARVESLAHRTIAAAAAAGIDPAAVARRIIEWAGKRPTDENPRDREDDQP